MIAFHGALTTVNYVDHLRRRFEATTQQSAGAHDGCAISGVALATVEGRRTTTRSRSLPLENSESTRRRLVSRGTQTTSAALARYVTAIDSGSCVDSWLRRIDAMDLSFPVARQSELRDFLADTLALAEHGSDAERNQQTAASKPRTPQMKRRRWAACDLCTDDGPSATANDGLTTALDEYREEWTDDDDDNEDDEILFAAMPVYGDLDCAIRSMITKRTPGCGAAETRSSYFRSGCRTVSRHPAPNMPMIREDEQSSSADDDDVRTGHVSTPSGHRSPLPAGRLSSPQSPAKSSTCSQSTRCSPATVADVDLTSCFLRPIQTSTNHHFQPVPATSSSSLLDAMHKKYCANQYTRRPATPSTPGCHGNTHLSDVVTLRSSTAQDKRQSPDRDTVAVSDFVTRQTDVEDGVTGNHVTSSRRGDSNAVVDIPQTSNTSTRFSETCLMSSVNTAPFGDEEDDEEEEEEERKGEERRNKAISEMCDDQPWKKRFCDYCHSELEVVHYTAR